MKTQIKVMPDGFVWRVLTTDEAFVLWQTEEFEIYHLDSDSSEHLIESYDEFNELVGTCTLAIEVGFIEPKVLTSEINWEQRRFRASLKFAAAFAGKSPLYNKEELCSEAITYADELIKQLKGE